MDLWIPSSVKPEIIQLSIQQWLDASTKHAYQNIIQDRVNSIYPTLSQHRTLYIANITSDRIVTLKVSPSAPPEAKVCAQTCPICLEHDTVVRHTLKCNHTFHLHCIDRWLLKNRTCPLCRVVVYYYSYSLCILTSLSYSFTLLSSVPVSTDTHDFLYCFFFFTFLYMTSIAESIFSNSYDLSFCMR